MIRTITVVLVLAGAAQAAGLKSGNPELKSAGPLTFGPPGILFIADSTAAAVIAVDTGDTKGNPAKANITVKGINKKIAGLLGTTADKILVNDLAVNPAGKLSVVSLKNVRHASVSLPNPPAPGGTGRRNRRVQSITDLAFFEGRLFIAGLSNEEFASTLRSIPYPFVTADKGTSVEIYHGAHGRFETRSPIRTFAPFKVDGKPHLLAAYTCTPLVKFPVGDLKPGSKIRGTTIAELGNRNRPLDMFVYTKGGKNYLLIANSSRGVMKVTTDGIRSAKGITTRVGGGGTAGLTYDKITQLQGVVQLDRLNADNAVVLQKTDSGATNLRTVALP